MRISKPLARSVTATAIMSMTITFSAVQAHADTRPAPAASLSTTAPSPEPVAVKDAQGNVLGYKVSPRDAAALASLDAEMAALTRQSQAGVQREAMSTADAFLCAGAVSGFIALTIFPTARAAKVAVRLAEYVNRLGVQKVAAILTRTYKGANGQQLFKEMALELSGIGGTLKACGIA